MIFKDRSYAAEKLAEVLKQDPEILKQLKSTIVVSLLRGGVIIGDVLGKKLHIPHKGLVVTKIPSPGNPELAIGALCFDVTYLDKKIVETLQIDRKLIMMQIKLAQEKQRSYLQRFKINEDVLTKEIKNKQIILTDDGIATGATARVALLYLKSSQVKQIVLAVPVAPLDFDNTGFDKTVILHQDPQFGSVSQFYENFPQVTDEEVKSKI